MKQVKKKFLVTLAILCLVLCIGCIVYLYQFYRGTRAHEQLQQLVSVPVETGASLPMETVPDSSVPSQEAQDSRVPLPVDFSLLQDTNEEIYAWLEIPGTGISVPVLQSQTDDLFYNNHGADGSYYSGGAVYSQRYNSLDFQDPMTLIYGHNFHDRSIFAPLIQYSQKDFFDANPLIRIYTPEKLYEYRIFAAYPYSSEHLLLCYDFSDPDSFSEFFSVLDNPSPEGSYRPENYPSYGDTLLTLSTCYRLTFGRRYLVQAVLTDTFDVKEAAA